MSIEIPEPDMDMLRRVYDFGGLLVYRVAYFDPVQFRVTNGRVTFSEEAAQEELEGLKRAGFTAGMEAFMVKFDGAFSKRPNVVIEGPEQAQLANGPARMEGSA